MTRSRAAAEAGGPGAEAGLTLGRGDGDDRRLSRRPGLGEGAEQRRRTVAAEAVEVVEDGDAALLGDRGEVGAQAVLVLVAGRGQVEDRLVEQAGEVLGDQRAAAAGRTDEQRRARRAAQDGVGEPRQFAFAAVQRRQGRGVDRAQAVAAGPQLRGAGAGRGSGSLAGADLGVGTWLEGQGRRTAGARGGRAGAAGCGSARA